MQKTDLTLSIEKCPDKSASVTFSHYFQMIRVDETGRNSLANSGYREKYDLLKHSKSSDLLKHSKSSQMLKESHLYRP